MKLVRCATAIRQQSDWAFMLSSGYLQAKILSYHIKGLYTVALKSLIDIPIITVFAIPVAVTGMFVAILISYI
jgi:hypothetical protein